MKVTTKELQKAFGVSSRKQAIRKAKESGALWREEGKALIWEMSSLPEEIQIKVEGLLPTRLQKQEIPKVFLTAAEKYRHIALLRSALVGRFFSSSVKIEEFVQMYNDGLICPAIRDDLGDLAIKTFYKWVKAWKDCESLDSLTPRWGANKTGHGSKALSEFEQGIAKALWLTQNKPAAAKVARDMQEIYRCEASEATVRRFLDSIPRNIASFFRDGKTKFESRFFPSIETDPCRYESMGMVISDHHTWDFIVDLGGKLVRPSITVFQDYRSRKVLSWAHSVHPSTVSITESLVAMIMRYGVPKILHIDNGKDYRSNFLNGKSVTIKSKNDPYLTEIEEHKIEGVFSQLGIKVIFTLPYHGQSKPIERSFGTFAGDFAKEFPTYVGSDSKERPEDAKRLHRRIGKLEKKECIVTWDDYVAAWEAYIEHFNATWKHSGKGMEGRTPGEVFQKCWKTRRNASPEFLEIALSKTEIRKVSKNGIMIGNVRYWAEELGHLVSQSVLVKQSFIDPKRATIWELSGGFLCYAMASYFAESDDLNETTQKISSARKLIVGKVKEFQKTIPKLEEGKRGIVDYALENRGQWPEKSEPEDLKIVQVSNGGFELPPAPAKLRLNEENTKQEPKYKTALDEE